MHDIFRTKSIAQVVGEPSEEGRGLKRVLGAKDLVALGIGAIIGAGIFATTGTAAAGGADHLGAGPAVVISYILVAIACGFCALCYAEFASAVPIAGSAYTYAYVSLGELAAWMIGWDLILEYAVGNVAVAISWSDYLKSLLKSFGIMLSPVLTTPTQIALKKGMGLAINLPALLIVAFMTALLVRGVKESVNFNNVVVMIKLVVLLVFIAIGVQFVEPANWSNFAPNGFEGIHGAAAVIFFAYIGFDAVSTAAEETENPTRNLPIGMIGSLAICTLLYVTVSAIMTGLAPYHALGTADPMATALEIASNNPALSAAQKELLGSAHFVVTLGAVVSLTAVLLVFQLGQPRIFFSMARDGLLPSFFAKVHPRFQTPYVTTILTGVLVALGASFFDISVVIELCNIGTLFAFVVVCAAVLLLRYRDGHSGKSALRPYRFSAGLTLLLALLLLGWGAQTHNFANQMTALVCAPLSLAAGMAFLNLPQAPARPFNAPFAPLIPTLGIVTCTWLMMASPPMTWLRFFWWLVAGLVVYGLYGYRHSRLRQLPVEQPGS